MSVAWLALTPGELNELTAAGSTRSTPTWVERVSPLAGSAMEWLTPTDAAEQLAAKLAGLTDPDLRSSLALSFDQLARVLGGPDRVLSVRFKNPETEPTVFVLASSAAGVVSLVLEREEILARHADAAELAGELDLLAEVASHAEQFAAVVHGHLLPGAIEFRDGLLVGHDEKAGLSLLGEFVTAADAVGWIGSRVNP